MPRVSCFHSFMCFPIVLHLLQDVQTWLREKHTHASQPRQHCQYQHPSWFRVLHVETREPSGLPNRHECQRNSNYLCLHARKPDIFWESYKSRHWQQHSHLRRDRCYREWSSFFSPNHSNRWGNYSGWNNYLAGDSHCNRRHRHRHRQHNRIRRFLTRVPHPSQLLLPKPKSSTPAP